MHIEIACKIMCNPFPETFFVQQCNLH